MRTPQTIDRGWWHQSVGRRILAAALTIGAVTVLVRLASFARELVIAREFGIGTSMDAFFLAFVVPAFVVAVISGSLNAALIPTYLRTRDEQGHEAAQRLFTNVTVATAALLVAAAALMALVFPLLVPLVATDFDSGEVALTQKLFLVLLPTIVLSGLATIWTAILNAGHRFAFAALTPIATPLLTIAFVLATAEVWGVYGIVVGILVGATAEVLLLATALRRHGLSLVPRWHGLTPETRTVLTQYAPMAIGSILMASTLIIDQAMAATLGSGAVSTLNYGQRVIGFALGVTALAVGTAVLPYFSRMVAGGEWTELRRTLNRSLILLFACSIPVGAALWLLARPIVGLLFEGGAFTSDDADAVSGVQQFLALQIPFFICGILVVRVVAALRWTIVLMWASVVCVIVNIGLNYVLMQSMGVEGIALSTSIVYVISFLIVWTAVRRKLRGRT